MVAEGILSTPLIPTVLVNGVPIGVVGTLVTPHAPCPEDPSHCAAVITTGSATVLAGGIQVSGVQDIASCGHSILTGSPNTLIG